MAVNIDCLLLAGGSSKRMGEPKMLLELGMCTLFEHVLGSHLESALRHICAVVPGWLEGFSPLVERHSSERVHFVKLSRECEMSESLKAGWKYAAGIWRPDAMMISLADKVLVTSDVIDSLISKYETSGGRICAPVFRGARGHPVVFSADLESEIYALDGDRGARDIMGAHRDDITEVPVDSDGVLVDVDTHEDFDEIRRRLNQVG